MNRNNIYVIVGPTASGKTKLSIELAKKIDACIINADASQFRRGLDIGTAKIKKEEMGQIDHYLIDIIDADEDFSIYDFQLLGRKILKREIEKRDVIIVGGSGLYINALLFDYDLSSEKRDKSEEKYKDLSNQELYEMLCSLNIELAQKTHFNNRNRVIRYLELAQSDSLPKKDPVLLYDNVHIYFIDRDRTELYDSINKRTIEMLESGWIEEVKGLKEKGVNLNKIKEIGYKEINDYLNGLIDKDKLIEIISQKTRNYAKRQVTWFKHQIDCKFIQSINDIDVINDSIVVSLKTNLLINSQNENYYLISTLLKIFKKVFDNYFKYNDIKIDNFNNEDNLIVYYFKNVNIDKLNYDLKNIKANHPLGQYLDVSINYIKIDNDINIVSIDIVSEKIKKYLSIEIKKIIIYACNLELNMKYKFGLITPYHKHNHIDIYIKRDIIDVIIYPFLDMFDAGFEYNDLYELNNVIKLIIKRTIFLIRKATYGADCYNGLLSLLGNFLGYLAYSIKNNQDITEISNNYNYIFKYLNILDTFDDSELYHLLIQLVKDNDDAVLLKEAGSIEKYRLFKDMISSLDYNDLEKIQEVSLEFERANVSIGEIENIFIVIVFYNLFKKIM